MHNLEDPSYLIRGRAITNGPPLALDLMTGSTSVYVREVPTSPRFRSASIARAVSRRYWRRPSLCQALMKDQPIAVTGLPGDFVSPDDEKLFAFVSTLRLAVKAKVAAEQRRGLTLAEIVVQVREMVRLAEGEAQHPSAIPASAFRSISRQAVAWCVEAFHPPAFVPHNGVTEQSP